MGKIIKDFRLLDTKFPAYLYPEIILKRDQYKQILQIFLDAIERKSYSRYLVLGDSGTGKTTLINLAIREAQDHAARKLAAYFVVVYMKATPNLSLEQVIRKILSSEILIKPKPIDLTVEYLSRVMKDNKVFLVLVIDELEKINNPHTLYNLFHIFGRNYENGLADPSGSYYLTPVFITNNLSRIKAYLERTGQADIDTDLESFEKIVIPHLNAEELYQIILLRSKAALFDSAYKVDENGNVPVFRIMVKELLNTFGPIGTKGRGLGNDAINMLRHSAISAEKRNATTIEKADVKNAIREIVIEDLKGDIQSLTEPAIIALQAILSRLGTEKKKTLEDFVPVVQTITFSEWYKLFIYFCTQVHKIRPVSDRQFRRYISTLMDKRLVGQEEKGKYYILDAADLMKIALDRVMKERSNSFYHFG